MVMTLETPQDGEAVKARGLAIRNSHQPPILHNEPGDFCTVRTGPLQTGQEQTEMHLFTLDSETKKVDHEGHCSSHKNSIKMAAVG